MVLKHLNQLQENIRLKGTSWELNGERLKQCLKGRVGQNNSCGPTWNQWSEEPQGAHVRFHAELSLHMDSAGDQRLLSCWGVGIIEHLLVGPLEKLSLVSFRIPPEREGASPGVSDKWGSSSAHALHSEVLIHRFSSPAQVKLQLGVSLTPN